MTGNISLLKTLPNTWPRHQFFVIVWKNCITQKMKLSIKDLFSKCDQKRSFQRIWSQITEEIFKEKLHFLCSVEYCVVKLSRLQTN